MSLVKKIFGSRNDRFVKSVQPIIKKINALEPEMAALDDEALKAKTAEYRERLSQGETLDDLLPEAFATVREAAKRTLGTPHYDVQLIGGIVLHRHKITEMKTGEGKTLVSTLAAYLNALPGEGVHVVTVNDYLAKRDAEWMGAIYEFLGLTYGYIISNQSHQERKAAYECDITYATNNELGFDYLRDNMAFSMEQRVQRLNYAIVDEVDSILIDEARTPLIISGPAEDKTDLYKVVNDLYPSFERGVDFDVDEKTKNVSLSDEGTDKAEQLLRDAGHLEEGVSLYAVENVMYVHHINQALRAHCCYKRDVDYVVRNGQVILVDEFTGRMMDGRRLSQGLHQALEAKENVKIQRENQTLASTTFQNYFRMYKKLAGMTGTADTEAAELESIYGLEVIVIPTHREVARKDETDIIYLSREAKDNAIVKDIRDCYERGQPVLVGTASIDSSHRYAERLQKERIPHKVLNALHHEQEAEIIAQAGRLGAVTIATNMAGRGTDIKLGGNIDLLLEGVEDEKAQADVRASYQREHDDVLDLGGLRVIGTERNESRRVDNQLRGRSGRQGDPGSSVFYISLEDDLMRKFARGLDGMMARMDIPRDEAIQSRLITGAIETAQRKIESMNFESRKALLKFDDVLNDQRRVIYDQRREIMESDGVTDIIEGFRDETMELLHARCFPQGVGEEMWQLETFKDEVLRLFNLRPDVNAWVESGADADDILERSMKLIDEVWLAKRERIGETIMNDLEKGILLETLDHQWKEHLQRLDFLKQGIHLRGYAQKDPLNEFKREAFAMFDSLLTLIRETTVLYLSRVEIQTPAQEEAPISLDTMPKAELTVGDPNKGLEPDMDADNPYEKMDIGRNDACPCGSGKKYKHCHGRIKAVQQSA